MILCLQTILVSNPTHKQPQIKEKGLVTQICLKTALRNEAGVRKISDF